MARLIRGIDRAVKLLDASRGLASYLGLAGRHARRRVCFPQEVR